MKGGNAFKDRSVSNSRTGKDILNASVGKCDDNFEVKSGKKRKFEKEGQFKPRVPGRYRAFYIEVDQPKQPSDKKLKNWSKLVSCLLCPDRRTLKSGNFGDHIKAFHLPPVQCEKCGESFSASRIEFHKKKCVSQNLKFAEENYKGVFLKSSRLKVNDNSAPSKVPPVMSDEVDINSPRAISASAIEDHCNTDDSHSASASFSVLTKTDSSQESSKSTEDRVSLTLSSATCDGVSIKIRVGKKVRMRKVMKKFGQKFKVNYKVLKFLLGGRELGGEELVGDLGGSKIVVWGALK